MAARDEPGGQAAPCGLGWTRRRLVRVRASVCEPYLIIGHYSVKTLLGLDFRYGKLGLFGRNYRQTSR